MLTQPIQTRESATLATATLGTATGRERVERAERPAVTWITLREPDALRSIADEWLGLAEQAEAGLCLTPQWIESWRATIAPAAQPQVVTAWDAGGRLAALWPMAVRRVGRSGVTWRCMETMGGAVASGDRLNPLRGRDGLDAALVQQVRRVAAQCADQIRWNEVSLDDPVWPAMHDEGGAAGRRLCDMRRLPTTALPRTFEAFVDGLSTNRRGLVRRRERQAERRGLTWRLVRGGNELPGGLEQFMRLHGERWASQGGRGNFDGSPLAAFIRDFGAAAAARGWLRLHRLCDGERTVAAMLVFHFAGRAYYYQSGWDPRAADISPGMLCLVRAMRCAIDEGVSVFDFMRGDEEYKSHWATDTGRTGTLLEAVTARGRLMVLGRDARERVKRGVVRGLGPAAWERMRRVVMGRA